MVYNMQSRQRGVDHTNCSRRHFLFYWKTKAPSTKTESPQLPKEWCQKWHWNPRLQERLWPAHSTLDLSSIPTEQICFHIDESDLRVKPPSSCKLWGAWFCCSRLSLLVHEDLLANKVIFTRLKIQSEARGRIYKSIICISLNLKDAVTLSFFYLFYATSFICFPPVLQAFRRTTRTI